MALQIDKTTDEGFVVSYWRVSPDIRYNVVDQTLRARVLAYVDSKARSEDKPSVPTFSVPDAVLTVSLEKEAAVAAIKSTDPRDALYAELKTLKFFAGAIDV